MQSTYGPDFNTPIYPNVAPSTSSSCPGADNPLSASDPFAPNTDPKKMNRAQRRAWAKENRTKMPRRG